MTVVEKMPMLEPAEKDAGQGEWRHALEALIADVTEWSQREDWDVLIRNRKADRDLSFEEHSFPVVEIDAHPQDARSGRDVKLILEPMTYNSATETGRVDFYVWPAMYRVRLIHKPGQNKWIVKTDSGLNWPHPWNRKTFTQIAQGLLSA